MDKETLSSYGWIVIITLVLAVMIALASPFGEFVGDGVVTVVNGFIDTNSEKLGDENMESLGNKWDQKFENGVNGAVPTVYELQKTYKFEYYSTLENATSDANANTIGTNADVDKKDAEAGIYVDENGRVNVVLLKDISLSNHIELSNGICLNLGGHKIKTNSDNLSQIINIIGTKKVIIDGRLKNSEIVYEGTKQNSFGIRARDNTNVEIIGLKYTVNENKNKVTNSNCLISIYNPASGNMLIKDCDIVVNSENSQSYGIYNIGTSQVDNTRITVNSKYNGIGISNYSNDIVVMNSEIYMYSENNISRGIYLEQGSVNVKIDNCKIESFSNAKYIQGILIKTPSNEVEISNSTIDVHSNKGQSAFALYIQNSNKILIKNCDVYSSYCVMVTEYANVYIDGGLYESADFILYSDCENNIFSFKNATFRTVKYNDEKYGFEVLASEIFSALLYFGEHQDSTNGMKQNNNKMYIDNCVFDNKIYENEEVRSAIIAIRNINTSGNELYISNSRIDQKNGIRIDNNGHKLYLGQGNNFTKESMVLEKNWDCVVETNDVYNIQ